MRGLRCPTRLPTPRLEGLGRSRRCAGPRWRRFLTTGLRGFRRSGCLFVPAGPDTTTGMARLRRCPSMRPTRRRLPVQAGPCQGPTAPSFGMCGACGGPRGGHPCGHLGPPRQQGRRHVEVACALEGQALSAVGRGAAGQLPSRPLNRALGHLPCQPVSGLAKSASAFAFALQRHGQSCEAWGQLKIRLGRVP